VLSLLTSQVSVSITSFYRKKGKSTGQLRTRWRMLRVSFGVYEGVRERRWGV